MPAPVFALSRASVLVSVTLFTLLIGCSAQLPPASKAAPEPTEETSGVTAARTPAVTPVEVESAAPTATPGGRINAPSTPAEADRNTSMDKPAPPSLDRRTSYDTTKSFEDLVKPHFYATAADGALTEIQGAPDLIVEKAGSVKIRLSNGSNHTYLDPLALESELIGDHPVHRLYRLSEMGVPFSSDLRDKLEKGMAEELFTSAEFEYQRRRFSSGVVAEVFPDGTLLVIPHQLPAEWQSADERVASPTHLHLTARAFSGGSSRLARDYELEILSLPFDDQRYPPAPLAKKQCDVYRESLEANDYAGVLKSAGFRFTPEHTTRKLAEGAYLVDRLQAKLWEGAGSGVQYFGFEGFWIGDVYRTEPVSWLGECDTAGGLRRYPGEAEESRRHYLTIRRSLEPDKRQRYKILEVDEAGKATELYTAPGIILMALPLPFDQSTWILSTEGWPAAEGGQPADPRWQAVYTTEMDRPDDYLMIRYPIDQFPKAPEAGLYGSSPRLSQDGNFLYNTLYGFTDEGGGIWVVDVSDPEFHTRGENFARIVSWDHTLSWMPLDRLEDDPTALHLFMTGKEVADDFAMTANILRIREDGLNSVVDKSERLLQMVGWNPVPFGWQKLSDTEYRMLVETHYNYESSLMPRAKGVYIIPVSLADE